MLRPAWPAPETSLFLSAVDIICRELPHNRRMLFYKLQNAGEYAAVVERLKASLSVVRRFLRPSWRGSLLRSCNSAASVTGSLCSWIWPHGSTLWTMLLRPLCVSRFECGSFALGVAHSHVVCDGTSLWHFLTSWAEIARGEPKLSLVPVHTRTLLKLDNPSAKKAFLIVEGVEEDTSHGSTEKEDLMLFHFSKETVKKLKAQVHGERSSYEAMCAHIWKHASVARGHAKDKEVSFIHVVNMRRRLHPPLPQGYFGNALMWTTAVAAAGELQEENLAVTADRIHASVAACDDTAFKGWLHWLEVHDRQEVFTRCNLNGARLRASSSTRFPVFAVDFGWGAPVAVRCPCMELAGKVIFFPSPDGFGSIDITLALPSPFMRHLANGQDFLHP
ncbi:hypothetical protein L7F22_038248 [Adiantum nelumboides]|nr:hypothetical protein [Adiantum nelumboides]